MGAYQSSPKTETEPLDVSDDRMSCGANAMQGWRMTQEDAHNVILSFNGDPAKALFAVYDGHGGAEVARYCSERFPDFLRNHEKFLAGDFEKCLGPAFLEFDATLVNPEVVDVLKQLAASGDDEPMRDASKSMFSLLRKRMKSMKRQKGIVEPGPDGDDESDSDDDPAADSDEGEEEVYGEVEEASIVELCEEAKEPIEFVLQKMQFRQMQSEPGCSSRTMIDFVSAGPSGSSSSSSWFDPDAGPSTSTSQPSTSGVQRSSPSGSRSTSTRSASMTGNGSAANLHFGNEGPLPSTSSSVAASMADKVDGETVEKKSNFEAGVTGNSELPDPPAEKLVDGKPEAEMASESVKRETKEAKPELEANLDEETNHVKENGFVNGVSSSAESTPEKIKEAAKENGNEHKAVVKAEEAVGGDTKPVEVFEETIVVNGSADGDAGPSASVPEKRVEKLEPKKDPKGKLPMRPPPGMISPSSSRRQQSLEYPEEEAAVIYEQFFSKDLREEDDESDESDDNFVATVEEDDDDDDDDDDDVVVEGPEETDSDEEDVDAEAEAEAEAMGMGEDEEDDDEEEEDASVEQLSSEDDEDALVGGDDEEEEDEDEEDEDAILCDADFLRGGDSTPGQSSGCTAVVALVSGNTVYVANAGDSRCVLCRAGIAVDLSVDHKPEDVVEFNRIRTAGGVVTPDGRVCGGLNLSRSFGDHSYKQNHRLPPEGQMITAYPDIRTASLGEDDEFLVLACDGIWNSLTSQEVVDFVREHLRQEPKPALSEICRQLFLACLAPDTRGDGTGCDNMTAIIVEFRHRRPKSPTPAKTDAGEPLSSSVQEARVGVDGEQEPPDSAPEKKSGDGVPVETEPTATANGDVNPSAAEENVPDTTGAGSGIKRPRDADGKQSDVGECKSSNGDADGGDVETAAKRVKLDTAEKTDVE